MSKSTWTLTAFVLALVLLLLLSYSFEPVLRAGGGESRRGFGVGSLRGSYGSMGRADGSKSVSVGVAEFDGRGGVTRFVRINASDHQGGRRLIDLTSVGTYTVDADGIGVIEFTNTFASGSTSEVTFDFVIRTTGNRHERRSPLAEDVVAVQRESGVTASLVEESFTRRAGQR